MKPHCHPIYSCVLDDMTKINVVSSHDLMMSLGHGAELSGHDDLSYLLGLLWSVGAVLASCCFGLWAPCDARLLAVHTKGFEHIQFSALLTGELCWNLCVFCGSYSTHSLSVCHGKTVGCLKYCRLPMRNCNVSKR